MEFEFIREPFSDEVLVRCNMEHQLVAHWLQEEIGLEKSKKEELTQLLEQVQLYPDREFNQVGREISVSFYQHEVMFEKNGLFIEDVDGFSAEVDQYGEDLSLYTDESSAACGLEDFLNLLAQWDEFIARR